MDSMFVLLITPDEHNVTSLTEDELQQLDKLKQDLRIIFLTIPFFLLAFGIPGNILTIMVLRSRSMKDNVFSYYLISMCSFNLLTLSVNLPRYINKGITGKEVNIANKNFCAFYRYISTTLVAISDWHLVVITGARLFFLIDRGKKYTHLYSSPFSTIFSLSLIMVLFEVPAVGFWIRFKDENGNPVECYLPGESLLVHLQLCVQTLIPAALLICLNIWILHIHRVQESGLMETEATSKLRKQLLVLVFLSNFQFIVSVFPLTIVYPNMRLFFNMSTSLGRAKSNITFGAVALLLYSTYATDFLVYCFFGRKFRKELFKLLHPLCSKLFPHRYNVSDHSKSDVSDTVRSRAASKPNSLSLVHKKSIADQLPKGQSVSPSVHPSEVTSGSSSDVSQSPPIFRNLLRWGARMSLRNPKSGDTLY
ncbi:uncharacterized protein LOC106062497 isoform X1 [Biomphalaria glabrata]|uniref:Uncharacterized protein LOC106062497 isoform X1 n=2 Tax=Biomphalaria glabrata TaxID=6526 RepID=A0A9W2YY65_BIOGL|nr:uncharacterized protein LOC106062497 isoform X1 [Biomphalaria glabrata]